MLNTHFADVKKVFDAVFLCKGTHLLAVFGRFNILIRCEVVHNQCDAVIVKHIFKALAFHFMNRHG